MIAKNCIMDCIRLLLCSWQHSKSSFRTCGLRTWAGICLWINHNFINGRNCSLTQVTQSLPCSDSSSRNKQIPNLRALCLWRRAKTATRMLRVFTLSHNSSMSSTLLMAKSQQPLAAHCSSHGLLAALISVSIAQYRCSPARQAYFFLPLISFWVR